jgi:hypothetical protein
MYGDFKELEIFALTEDLKNMTNIKFKKLDKWPGD